MSGHGVTRVCLVMAVNDGGVPPILAQKHYAQPSEFTPENPLREARRQKRTAGSSIPEICVPDPDGDIVRSLLTRGEARLEPGWACYHTQLYPFGRGGFEFGIVGCAVGASYAVLIAEEMFASGCKLLISVTSTDRTGAPAALFHHHRTRVARRRHQLSLHGAVRLFGCRCRIDRGARRRIRRISRAGVCGRDLDNRCAVRETRSAIDGMCRRNLMAVGMEAAALYAFAQVRQRPVLCFAHVTNQMGRIDGDFEKGEADGSHDALQLITIAGDRLRSRLPP